MCYPKPGPRCAPHAKSQLDTANRRVNAAATKVREATEAITNSENALANDGYGMSYSSTLLDTPETMKTLATKREAAVAELREARQHARTALRDYAATDGGRKDIEGRLERAERDGDKSKVKTYQKMLAEGKMMAGWRQNALSTMKETGRVAIAPSKLRNKDNTLKFTSDGLGVLTDDTEIGGSIQVGRVHSTRFYSADKSRSVTPQAYSVALDAEGKELDYDDAHKASSWGYQVSTEYTDVKSEEVLDITYSTHGGFNSEEEASLGAHAHIERVTPQDIKWDGVSRL